MAQVTLREVAARANVSVATVSYVLSGKGRMAAETRRTIERLLRDAGIRPRYKRYPVVYISDHAGFGDMHAFRPFLEMFGGLNGAFREADLTLRIEFLNASPGGGSIRQQIAQMLPEKVGGVVLDDGLKQNVEEIAKYFDKQQIPVVQVGHTVRSAAYDAVVVDSFGGAYKAARHFIETGHTRIATIRWDVASDPASPKKFAGFSCALGEAGIPVRPEYVVESPHTKVGDQLPGRVAVEQLLALPEPPTAVFVENSFISPSLIYTIDPNEREIPKAIRDLDIIHFEAWHLEWLEQVMAGKLRFPCRNVKLLRINWEEVGRVAARRVRERMEGAQGAAEVFQIVPKLYRIADDKEKLLDVGM